MLAKLTFLHYWFSRSRLRKGPVIDPKLKDFTQTYDIQKQIQAEREKFEIYSVDQTFSSVLQQSKPKLKKRFKIDTVKLNKDLKQNIKSKINLKMLQPVSQEQNDLKFLEEGKSHLNDQRAEVDFQQKFQKQLFLKKQTNRLIKKEDNNFKNFLPQNKDNRYNVYIDAKKKLKNNRIESMMNYKRNNEQLQLLIESGLMEEPDNLKMLINKMNGDRIVHQIEEKNNIQQQSQSNSKQSDSQSNFLQTILTKQLSQQQTMTNNVQGPQQLRDYAKIQQFMQMYNTNSEQQKLKVNEDVDLLLHIREYERNLFLSRYDAVNFRFRGRVQFDFFKEPELLSYIKHEVIDPKELLTIFQQSHDELNRFNVPIITPAVMSRIYSKTSLYKFSQNDQNNHINLLNDPVFKKLERNLFKELDKISDQLFCDTVWAYAKNHEVEQGLLNVKMSDAIQRAIFSQIGERINRLREVDLGLMVRALMKLNIMKSEYFVQKWGEIIEALQNRIPIMKESYQYESVMQFVSMIPTSSRSMNLLGSNISFYKKYPWQSKQTVLSYIRVGSALLNNNEMIDPLEHNKIFLVLRQTIMQKVEQLKVIIPTLTINEIPRLMVVFEGLNKYLVGPAVPAILVNIAKKQIVSNIITQKGKLYQYTIPTLLATLSAYDYYANLIKKQSKFINKQDLFMPAQSTNLMKIVPLRHLLPGRVYPFNSKLYFVYHQLAKILEKQQSSLSLRSLGDSLFALSLVQYKNQGIYDSITYKMLQKIQKNQGQRGVQKLSLYETTQLMKGVSCYSHQKRTTNLIEQIYSKLLQKGKQNFKSIKLNILIRFFGTYVNLFTLPTSQPEKDSQQYEYLMERWSRNKSMLYVFAYSYRHYIKDFIHKLQNQQVIVLYLINSLFLSNTSKIIQVDKNKQQEFGEINKRFKKNIGDLLKLIRQIPAQKLKVDYQFALSLCYELNKIDIEADYTIKHHFSEFNKIQKDFYQRYIQDILDHQQFVGISISYNHLYAKIAKKLKQQNSNPNQNVEQKVWRIQVKDKKTVYFIATYEHLMSKTEVQGTSLGLFGLWKIYSQLYRRNGWKFELICSMLQQ